MVNQNSVVVKQEPEEQNGNLLQSNENGVNHQESNGNGTANGNGVRQLSQSNGHNGHPALQVKEEGKDAGIVMQIYTTFHLMKLLTPYIEVL